MYGKLTLTTTSVILLVDVYSSLKHKSSVIIVLNSLVSRRHGLFLRILDEQLVAVEQVRVNSGSFCKENENSKATYVKRRADAAFQSAMRNIRC